MTETKLLLLVLAFGALITLAAALTELAFS